MSVFFSTLQLINIGGQKVAKIWSFCCATAVRGRFRGDWERTVRDDETGEKRHRRRPKKEGGKESCSVVKTGGFGEKKGAV